MAEAGKVGKSGTDRRRALFRAGLLTALWWAGAFSAPAQQGYGAPPFAEVRTPAEAPAAGSPWVITFLLDHPSPGEAAIRYPPLPPAVSLESIRIGALTERAGPDALPRRGTVIEVRLLPLVPGPVLLGPFEINVPDRAPYISPVISVHIQGTALREPYCAWTAPDFLVVGRRGELSLRLFNRDPAMPLPKPELLWRGVPVKTVVEEAPLSEADRKEGIALRLTVIPLDSGGAGAGNMDSEGSAFFTFDALQLRHEGVLLTVPALRIPVVPAKKEKKEKEKEKEEKEASGARETPSAERPGAGGNPAPLFPETPLPVFPPARGGYEKALGKVRLLWDQGRRAECLAEIRRLERDTLQGPYFALSRREAERRLGFAFSADEPWRPRVLLFGSLFGSLGALVFPGLSVRRLAVSRRRIPLFQAVACAALLTGAALSGRELLTAQRQALFREDAPVYRIPDGAGGISAYLREGEPARVLSVSEYWIHIETLDGRIGWTRKDTVIFY